MGTRNQGNSDAEQWLGAADCARRTGLTVRALRVYERRGLIQPHRTAKGWRLYGRQHLARLAAIVTLKSLGLSLAEVGHALRGEPGLDRLLAARADAWRALASQARQALAITESALTLVQSGQPLQTEQLCDLVRSMQMSEMPKVFREQAESLYTPEEISTLTARKMAMADDPSHGAQAWATLLDEVKALVARGADPASPEAQEAGKRWGELVRAFSGGDRAVEGKSRQLWEGALAADPEGRELPFGADVWDFIRRVAAAKA